jgi:glutathione S-transferase
MIKLYGGSRSRASIVQWYLEEINTPYEFVLLDMQAGEHRQPEYLKINPIGKVPAIVDGDLQLWESGAILLYLADKYSQKSYTPEARAILNQWIIFANSTLGTGIFIEANREREMARLLNPLNDIFSKQNYLLGEEFTIADIAVGSILFYIPIMLKIEFTDYPAIAEYITRISQRPAFQKTIGGR